MMNLPSVLIIGAGAIGSLVGGKLAQAGAAVTFAGRPAFAEAVRHRGLILTDAEGSYTLRNLTAAASITEACASAPFDLVIITVKSYDTAAALAELLQALAGAPIPAMLSLQNGVGNEATIAAALAAPVGGSTPVIAGIITTPVSVLEQGSIRVDKADYTLGISPWHPSLPATIVPRTIEALRLAGFAVTPYASAQSMKWSKLLMNIVGNAGSAILDLPPDRLFATAQLVDLEIAAWREALAVMRAAGIAPVRVGNYPFNLLAPLISYAPKNWLRPLLRARVGKARGGKMPSLHIDLHSGRAKSEVMWLNGAVVEKGREVSVATPVNQTLTEVLCRLVAEPGEIPAWRDNSQRLFEAIGQQR
jgi:2-dehydropantoate 2-reductase